MSARSKARKRALDILYAADVRGVPALTVLGEASEQRAAADEPMLNEHTVAIVSGVTQHAGEIDELLSSYSMGWTLPRMPAVDRAILRIGTFELLWCPDVPDAVAIAEAVALARDLSTDESATFVNGLLARLLGIKPRIAPTP